MTNNKNVDSYTPKIFVPSFRTKDELGNPCHRYEDDGGLNNCMIYSKKCGKAFKAFCDFINKAKTEKCAYVGKDWVCLDNRTYKEILSRHKAVEPLAVLADRKGYFISWADGGSGRKVWTGKWENRKHQWLLCIEKDHDGDNVLHFWGDTYAACEAKAREYLENLPTTTEKEIK